MKQHLCPVLETRPLWAEWQLLTFDAPELARAIRPGQFALARDPSTLDPYLRRTLWLYEIRDARVSFLINARDPLAQRVRAGDTLDLLAPLGRAITFEPSARHLLLIGEGARIPPLIAIAHDAVKLGKEVVLVSRGEVFPTHLLAPEVEYRSENAFDAELIAWADEVVASGTENSYRDLSNAIRAARLRFPPGFARVWSDLPMPCGIGICYACAVDTSRGMKLVCVDGPALDLVEWERRM